MTARPSLVRSIPFWVLIAGSLATVVLGAWLVLDKLTTMNSTLLDGTATGVEVYGGQSLITLGAVLIGAGLVGFVAALFLGVLRSFVPAAPVEVADPIDWAVETEPVTEPDVAVQDEAVTDAPEPSVTR